MDLTASQARKQALSRRGRIDIDDVMSHIQMSVNCSKFECTYYKILTAIQKQRLEELGYTIITHDYSELRETIIRNEISW